MPAKNYEKHKNKLFTVLLIVFASTIGIFFWKVIRSNIVLTSCSEIALNSTHVQSRANLFIDTNESYELNLNDCLSQAGINR